MTVLYTKYKAENNALWTIYVKYGLKIYREVWKFEYGILKWKMCRNPEQDKNIEENHFEEKVKPAETLLSKWPKLPISPLSA